MLLVIAVLKNLELSQENIGCGDSFLGRAFFLEVYNKLIFLINATEYGYMLISSFKLSMFDIFILPVICLQLSCSHFKPAAFLVRIYLKFILIQLRMKHLLHLNI